MVKILRNLNGTTLSSFEINNNILLKDNSGILEARDTSNNFIQVRGAKAIGFDDLVTYAQVLTKGQYYTLNRVSTNQIEIVGLDSQHDFIIVNNERVLLNVPISCDISGANVRNLIASDGSDSGTQPIGDRSYYIYISNSQVSWAPSKLALSYTAPTNGYLGNTGLAANWRFVGFLVTDQSAATLSNDWQLVCPGKIETFKKGLQNTITRTSGTDIWYTNFELNFSLIALMPKTFLICHGSIRGKYNTTSGYYTGNKIAIINWDTTVDKELHEFSTGFMTADYFYSCSTYGIYNTNQYIPKHLYWYYYYDINAHNTNTPLVVVADSEGKQTGCGFTRITLW